MGGRIGAALALWAATGCDTLECGPGTHREGDACVPNVLVSCGAGTMFTDGRCESTHRADGGSDGGSLTCGPGTTQVGDECLPVERPDGTPPRDAAPRDAAETPDSGPETDAEVTDAETTDARLDAAADMAAPDMAAPPPRCPPGLEPADPPADCGVLPPDGYCVLGVARDFVTNCALPAGTNLTVALIDPIVAAAGRPQDALRGGTLLQGGGAFAIIGRGDSQALAIIIDENPMQPEPNTWVRSVSGVSAEPSVIGQTYAVTAFASSLEAESRWSRALGEDPLYLQTQGFLIGRVLTPAAGGLGPLDGAEVTARMVGDLTECVDMAPCLRFFDDDPRLTSFQPEGAQRTGASGAFLIIRRGEGTYRDRFYVADPDGVYPEINAGANAGSGFHTAFVPRIP